jgi:hypothetical protein
LALESLANFAPQIWRDIGIAAIIDRPLFLSGGVGTATLAQQVAFNSAD